MSQNLSSAVVFGTLRVNFACFFFVVCCFFSKSTFFKKKLSGIPSESVWIQIRSSVLLSLILVQTFCNGEQQTSLVGKELNSDMWTIKRTKCIIITCLIIAIKKEMSCGESHILLSQMLSSNKAFRSH